MNICAVGSVVFPDPSDTWVNMMPFAMGKPETIPGELHAYLPLIEACELEEEQIGKIGYLSVSESFVPAGASQRRLGLHTEKHPLVEWGGGWGSNGEIHQGMIRSDGLYVASTTPDSCHALDAHVDVPGPMEIASICAKLYRWLNE